MDEPMEEVDGVPSYSDVKMTPLQQRYVILSLTLTLHCNNMSM